MGQKDTIILLRSWLKNIFQEHDPTKVSQVRNLITKYKDNLSDLVNEIIIKYKIEKVQIPYHLQHFARDDYVTMSGVETVSLTTDERAEIQDFLEQIYTEKKPHKLKDVPVLMSKYEGREHILIGKLLTKYHYKRSMMPTNVFNILRKQHRKSMISPPVPKRGMPRKVKADMGKSSYKRTPESSPIRGRSTSLDSSVRLSREEIKAVEEFVRKIYSEENPRKVESVQFLMEKYEGRENELVHKIVRKYKVESIPDDVKRIMEQKDFKESVVRFAETNGVKSFRNKSLLTFAEHVQALFASLKNLLNSLAADDKKVVFDNCFDLCNMLRPQSSDSLQSVSTSESLHVKVMKHDMADTLNLKPLNSSSYALQVPSRKGSSVIRTQSGKLGHLVDIGHDETGASAMIEMASGETEFRDLSTVQTVSESTLNNILPNLPLPTSDCGGSDIPDDDLIAAQFFGSLSFDAHMGTIRNDDPFGDEFSPRGSYSRRQSAPQPVTMKSPRPGLSRTKSFGAESFRIRRARNEVDDSPVITPAQVAASEELRMKESIVRFDSTPEFRSTPPGVDVLRLSPGLSRCSTIDPDTIPDLLSKITLFHKFTEDQILEISFQMTHRKYQPGDTIMKAHEAGDEFFVVQQGICAVTSHTGRHLEDLYEGDYFGEQALLKKTKRVTTVKAITQTVCLVLDSTTFNGFLREVLQSHDSYSHKSTNPNVTANKRKGFLTNASASTKNVLAVYDTSKPELTRTWLQRLIASNHLFENFNNDQQEHIVDVMYKEEFEQNEVIINEGDISDKYYVVERGSIDVSVVGMGTVNVVTAGKGFGVKALLGDEPRTATCTAVGKVNVVWTLDRQTLRNALEEVSKRKMMNKIRMLQDVEIFHHLRVEELVLLEEALAIQMYDHGHLLIRQGDPPDKFYIIKRGTATWTKVDEHGNEESGDMPEGSVFGEVALLDDSVRAASVRAKTQLTVWEMERDDFTELLGPYMEIEARARLANRFTPKPHVTSPDATDITRSPSIRARNVSNKAQNAGGICALEELYEVGLLGKGAFGAVTLVKDPNTDETYALKTIKKARVVETGTQEYIINEKEIMVKLDSRFCVNLEATYKDEKHVYFLLQVCLGGDMFALLQEERFLEVDAAKFYAACVIEAFDHMHSMHVIYRDLKPENLVLDEKGYLMITDYGFAKQVGEERTYTFCGTPEYLAPEMIKGDGHGKGLDWWTLGILIFEMLTSTTPFAAPDTFDITRKILKSQISFPKYFTSQTKTLLLGLLRKKPHRRLGVKAGGADMIRQHPWFTDFDWEALRNGSLEAPLDLSIENNTDLSNFQNEDDDSEDESETDSINSSEDDFCEGF